MPGWYFITTLSSLTTVFTPVPSCLTLWTYEASNFNDYSAGLLIQTAIKAGSADTDCFPYGYTHYGRRSQDQIYSPGYCPLGYTAPLEYVNDDLTTLMCCQSSFTYFMSRAGNKDDSVLLTGCISTYPESSPPTTVDAVCGNPNRTELLSSTIVDGEMTMWGQPIAVAFRQQDLSLYITRESSLTPSSAASPSSSPLAQTAASTPHFSKSSSGPVSTTVTPTRNSSAIAPPSSVTATQSSLSPIAPISPSPMLGNSNSSPMGPVGARVGLGIGAAGLGLCLLGFAIFLLRRRRHRSRPEGQRRGSWPAKRKMNPQPGELDTPPSLLDSNALTEMSGQTRTPVAEMGWDEFLRRGRPSTVTAPTNGEAS